MEVGKIQLGEGSKAELRRYLYKGLTGVTDSPWPMHYPLGEVIAVATSGMLRIVTDGGYEDLIFVTPWIKMPTVPLAEGMDSTLKTIWLQIAIAIADQVGLLDDPALMGAIEKRVTEEVLEGKLTAESMPKVAASEGGEEIKKFAWSKDGQLAALVAGTWRLTTGEVANVHSEWAIVTL